MSHKKSRPDSFVRCYDVGNPTKHPDGFTIYKVTQQLIQVNALEKNTQEAVTWKRYNDFKKLYKSMFSLHKALHRREEFPEFARAQLFNRFDVSVIEERRRSAQDLLNFVGQRHYLVASQPFQQFFVDAQPVPPKPQTSDNLLKPLMAGNSNSDTMEQSSALSSCSADSAATNGILVPVPAAECGPTNLLDYLPAKHLPSGPGSMSPPFVSPDRSVSASPESQLGEHACEAADATPTLGGIWLHRQLPEDIGSIDEVLDSDHAGSEEDHCDGVTYPDPGITVASHGGGEKCLDKSDIAAFDSLLSAPLGDNLAATSNLELLSMITTDVAIETPVAMETAAAVEMPVADITDDVSSRITAAIDDDQDPWSTSKTTQKSLSASFNAGDVARPRLGSIIESGRGDLTISPVHHTAPPVASVAAPSAGSGGSQIPALLRAGASLARSKLSLPWKSSSNSNLAGNSTTTVSDGHAGYILEAAELISQAQEHETGGNFPAAYCHYRSGIEILVKGVQKDTNKERQHAVGMKMNKYLLKADELYQAHLAGSSGQEVWNRWGSECETEVDAGVALLRAPAASLKNLRVIGVISGVLLVVDTATEGTYVIKVLHKSCTEPMGSRSIIPTHIPYVVSLVRFYETDSAIYLLLQHAAGGRLWSYIGAYLNQCTEMSPDVLANPDCQPPLLSSPRQQTTGMPSSTDPTASGKSTENSRAGDNASQNVVPSDEKDVLSRFSLTEADDTLDPLEVDVATVTVDPDYLSPGFGEMLRKTALNVEFFSIDSGDSESLSRQVSSSSDLCRCDGVDVVAGSAAGLSSDPIVIGSRTTVMQGNTGEDGQSLNETSIYDSCRLYDQNSNSDSSVSEDLSPPAKLDADLDEESAAVRIHNTTTVSVSLSDSTAATSVASKDTPTRRPSMMLRLSSQDRSFETSGRRRHRTLSSAFGELDLASTNEATVSGAPRLPKVVHLPESCVRQWAAEMVVAISRLHSLGIICRDLRPANILLGDRGHILLTYFSRWNTVDWTLNEHAVDNLYCAPEVRNVQPVTPACDWWSLGAVVYELLTGQTLRSSHPAGVTSHTTLIVPTDISSEAQSLLQELLRFSPTERLGGGLGGADDIRAHPFFAGIIWNNLLG